MYVHNVVGTGSYTTSTANMYHKDRFHVPSRPLHPFRHVRHDRAVVLLLLRLQLLGVLHLLEVLYVLYMLYLWGLLWWGWRQNHSDHLPCIRGGRLTPGAKVFLFEFFLQQHLPGLVCFVVHRSVVVVVFFFSCLVPNVPFVQLKPLQFVLFHALHFAFGGVVFSLQVVPRKRLNFISQ